MLRRLPWIGSGLALLALVVWFCMHDPARDASPAVSHELDEAAASSMANAEPPLATPPASTSKQRTATPAAPAIVSAPTPSDLFARGRVVDARRFPAVGSEVRLVRGDGSTEDARANERGEFAFAIAHRPARGERVQLWAWREGDAVIANSFMRGSEPSASSYARPEVQGDIEFGTLALTEARPLSIELVHAGAPASGGLIDVRLPAAREVLWHGVADVSGRAVTPPLPQGPVDLVATNQGFAATQRVFLTAECSLRLELVPQFSVAVTVVDRATSRGIPGALVRINQTVYQPQPFTGYFENGSTGNSTMLNLDGRPSVKADESGVARLEGLCASLELYAQAEANGYVSDSPMQSHGKRLLESESTLRIELAPLELRTVRFPIAEGEAAALADGSKVSLTEGPGSRSPFLDAPARPLEGVVRAGEVHVAGASGRMNYLGVAEDGSIAAFWCDEKAEVGRPVTFRPARTIEVLAKDSAGAPIAGVIAQARNQGNNPLGDGVTTDVEGRAVLKGLYGDRADVYVSALPPYPRETNAGTVNLKDEDGRVETVLEVAPLARATLEVTLDGVRSLPSRFRLGAGPGGKVVEERPDKGELDFNFAKPGAGKEVKVSLTAENFLPASTTFIPSADDSPSRCAIELVHGATLVGRVSKEPKQSVEIGVAVWDEAKASWGAPPGQFGGIHGPNGPAETYCFGPLGAGRYRLTDSSSDSKSDAVEISKGMREVSLDFDLQGLEDVTGRVEADDPAQLARARVICPGREGAPGLMSFTGSEPPKGAYVNKDGTFKLRVKRGESSRIEVWHPWLAPAEPGGSAVVDGAREGVVLRLVEGAQLKLAVPQLVSGRREGFARVAVYAGKVSGKPIAWIHAPIIEGLMRFRGVPLGLATLWIDPGQTFAPLVLEDVLVGGGVVDLGTAQFARGSALSLRLEVAPGTAAPRVYINAVRDAQPSFTRSINSNGEERVLLTGLEAGEYRVRCDGIMGRGKMRERMITVDGVNDVELNFD